MSRSSAAVRFKDGTGLFGIYDGTCSIMRARLVDSDAEAWDTVARGDDSSCSCGRDEHVEIATDYGSGFHWEGRACRHCKVITLNRDSHAHRTLPSEGWGRGDPDPTNPWCMTGLPTWAIQMFRRQATPV